MIFLLCYILISITRNMFSFGYSVLFNLSKFFEVNCVYHQVEGYDTSGNNNTDIPVNITSDICQPQVLKCSV